MTLDPGRTFGIALLVGVAALATACGGSSSGGNDTVTPRSGGEGATIAVSDGHLVDGDGLTLYLFEADKSTTSTCSGACAAAWPPVTTDSDPTAGDGAKAGLLGTTQRDDASAQVTYAGHPLYRYSGDSAAGDMNGAGSDAFGAEWYPLTPSGKALESAEDDEDMDSSPSPSSDDDYSYSY